MIEPRSLGLAAALLVATAAPALALDNVVIGDGRCDCMCESANAALYSTYDSRGYGCSALENRTCNVENPNTGLIETGHLWGCGPTNQGNGSAAAVLNGLLDRGDLQVQGGGQATVRPGAVSPLPGLLGQ